MFLKTSTAYCQRFLWFSSIIWHLQTWYHQLQQWSVWWATRISQTKFSMVLRNYDMQLCFRQNSMQVLFSNTDNQWQTLHPELWDTCLFTHWQQEEFRCLLIIGTECLYFRSPFSWEITVFLRILIHDLELIFLKRLELIWKKKWKIDVPGR